jgi:hypothetical protein
MQFYDITPLTPVDPTTKKQALYGHMIIMNLSQFCSMYCNKKSVRWKLKEFGWNLCHVKQELHYTDEAQTTSSVHTQYQVSFSRM